MLTKNLFILIINIILINFSILKCAVPSGLTKEQVKAQYLQAAGKNEELKIKFLKRQYPEFVKEIETEITKSGKVGEEIKRRATISIPTSIATTATTSKTTQVAIPSTSVVSKEVTKVTATPTTLAAPTTVKELSKTETKAVPKTEVKVQKVELPDWYLKLGVIPPEQRITLKNTAPDRTLLIIPVFGEKVFGNKEALVEPTLRIKQHDVRTLPTSLANKTEKGKIFKFAGYIVRVEREGYEGAKEAGVIKNGIFEDVYTPEPIPVVGKSLVLRVTTEAGVTGKEVRSRLVLEEK